MITRNYIPRETTSSQHFYAQMQAAITIKKWKIQKTSY